MAKGRPTGDGNRLKRLRAFELYSTGHKKAEIARTVGTTKATVSHWSKRDDWNGRLAQIVSRAAEAADLTLGETVADIAVRIRNKYDQRLRELDGICTSPLTPPQAKISAIKAWFELGKTVQPDAFKPLSDPRNLELIQDLLDVSPVSDPRQTTPATPAAGASGSTADTLSPSSTDAGRS